MHRDFCGIALPVLTSLVVCKPFYRKALDLHSLSTALERYWPQIFVDMALPKRTSGYRLSTLFYGLEKVKSEAVVGDGLCTCLLLLCNTLPPKLGDINNCFTLSQVI